MCRLFAIASREPLSPMVAIEALNVMREGHDGSGVGLFLRDLSGPFEDMKDAPILSGIFSEAGLKRLAMPRRGWTSTRRRRRSNVSGAWRVRRSRRGY